MNARKQDPLAQTVVLPQDEIAARRERKRLGHLTPSQVERLLLAAELRKKATQPDE